MILQISTTLTIISSNLLLQFLVAQKKKLRQSDGGNILALQNQLYMAEQQAAHTVARHIAANPPKTLMAVISPENVGGFSGRKRAPPGKSILEQIFQK